MKSPLGWGKGSLADHESADARTGHSVDRWQVWSQICFCVLVLPPVPYKTLCESFSAFSFLFSRISGGAVIKMKWGNDGSQRTALVTSSNLVGTSGHSSGREAFCTWQ